MEHEIDEDSENKATNEDNAGLEQKKPGGNVYYRYECRSGEGKTVSQLLPLIRVALLNWEGATYDFGKQPEQQGHK